MVRFFLISYTHHIILFSIFPAAKGMEKERLLEGGSKDIKPQARTIDEIKAKYKKAGSGAGVRCLISEDAFSSLDYIF